jgi:cytidine deaminase
MPFPTDVENAFQAALKARTHSHSPYSRFPVGSALQIEGESEPIVGCNVENANLCSGICAEQVALVHAVARYGRIKPQFMVIVTGEKEATVPCAQCLQVMAELCTDDMKIYLGNEEGIQKLYALKELLPYPFRSFQAEP